jgi:hypothetical protein
MSERPITFPKTDDGEWTNHETGVQIVKRHPVQGGYKVWAPDITGELRVRVTGSLADARTEATRHIQDVARPTVAAAYVEAVAEHIERAEREALRADSSTSRPDAARREAQAGNMDMALMQVRLMEDFTLDAARRAKVAERAPQLSVGDLVVFTDPEGTGIDTDTVWRIEEAWDLHTERPYAELVGYAFPSMQSASYFDRLAPAPRCTAMHKVDLPHEFSDAPLSDLACKDDDEWYRCGKLRTDDVHNTDQARAAAIIHTARDHEGVPAGKPYGGEWPGTTVIEPKAPADLSNEAWAEYVAALPPASPEAVADVAVEYSAWTSHRANAVEGFRSAARMLWSLRAEGLALPGSDDYRLMRDSMRHFRELIQLCDRQNDALRRELAATS